MNRKISAGLLIACFVVMTLWDIYPALTPETGDTISEVVRDVGTTVYFLPYVCGIVMGHFFFNRPRDTRNLQALWVSISLLLLRDFTQLGNFHGGNGACFVIGLVAGHVWWPQEVKDGNPQE